MYVIGFNCLKVLTAMENSTESKNDTAQFADIIGNLTENNFEEDPFEININLTDDVQPDDNCTNDYCIPDADYINMMMDYIFPVHYEWVMVCLYTIVFVTGVVGNGLVCLVVYRNQSMRTVTNYFYVNLAVADLLVLLLCAPPTIVWDVTETWIFGPVACKIVIFVQTVSVTVSVLTLTAISVERFYAICHPLRFISSPRRAATVIIGIWIVAIIIDLAELFVLQSKQKPLRVESILFTQCTSSWDNKSEIAFQTSKLFFLYLTPLGAMCYFNHRIFHVLVDTDNIPGQSEMINHSVNGRNDCSVNIPNEGPIQARRKAAKMLVMVIILFAVCYAPVNILNVLRYLINIPQNHYTGFASLLSHWLCYFNSAINPLIYNFMSEKFRVEFRRTFGCCRKIPGCKAAPTRSNTCTSRTRPNPSHGAVTEMLPLSSIREASPEAETP